MELNIENLMNTAIQEMENGQHTEAYNHFDMVVINDASNIDAPFFRAYCKCMGNIKLVEMPNAARNFENAFSRYVDDVKKLNDPVGEKEKLDRAVTLLTKMVSHYQYNATKNPGFIGKDIASATINMNDSCIAKLNEVSANVSNEILEQNESQRKTLNQVSAFSPKLLISILIVVLPLLYLIGLWIGSSFYY